MKRSLLRKSTWAAVLAVIVAGVLTLTACGGSGATTSQSPSASPMAAAALSPTPSPTPPSEGWCLRIYNVDDVGKAYVNGELVSRVCYLDDSGWVDITDYVEKTGGKTAIRFTTYNKGEGYTWGFQIARAPDDPDSVVWTAEEGRAGSVGANDSDQKSTDRIAYDKTVHLKDLPMASPSP